MRKLIPLSLTLALLLVGCSSTESSDSPSSSPAEGSKTEAAPVTEPTLVESPSEATASGVAAEYAFATGMTFGKVKTSGTLGKEMKAFLDGVAEYKGEGYEDEITVWSVKIDNREGFEEAFPNEFRAYDKNGSEYLFVRGLDLVEAVQEQLPDAPDASGDSPEWKTYEELFDLYSAAFDAESYSANPGAVKEFTIISVDDLPDEVVKMTIDLGGLVGEADVITLDDAASQGYPLDF